MVFEWDTAASLPQTSPLREGGLALALVRGTPYLLVDTDDSRPREWGCENCNTHFLAWTSEGFSSPLEFSALAAFVTLWQSAVPGAQYVNVSDFFDFFDPGTAKWLRAALTADEYTVALYVQHLPVTDFTMPVSEQSMTAHFEQTLQIGTQSADAILERRRVQMRNKGMGLAAYALSPAQLGLDFAETKRLLFASWPADPYQAFIRDV